MRKIRQIKLFRAVNLSEEEVNNWIFCNEEIEIVDFKFQSLENFDELVVIYDIEVPED